MGNSALVTGATGFLGQQLCRNLRAEGWDVTAMRRDSSDVSGLRDLDLDWVVGDILGRNDVHRAVEGHEYVFHLAGIGLMDAEEKTVWRVNVEGTRNVLDACRETGVERMLFTSTAGTRRTDGGLATEADVAEPVGAYQRSKAQAETLVDAYVEDGYDAVTVHPTSIFGPGDEKFTAKLLLLAAKPVPVYLPGGVSIVSVDDVTRGIISAMKHGRRGEHYLLGGENLTFGEALDILAECFGGSKPPIRIPPVAIHAAGPVVGTFNRLLGTRLFPVNGEMARLSTQTLFYSSEKAENELGYTFEPLQSHAYRAIERDQSADDSDRSQETESKKTPKRYVVFTNTPAQVHLFRQTITRLMESGHDVLVLGRDYGCTRELLEYYEIPFEIYGKCETTKGSVFRELPKHYLTILRKMYRYDPDLVFGMGGYASVAGVSMGVPVVLVVDSEPDGLDHQFSTRIAQAVLTPHSFRKDFGDNQYTFNGFKECAYLHPKIHTQTGDVRKRLDIPKDESFALLRFNAFGAHHDIGHEGITPQQRRLLIEELAKHVTVFVSDEAGEMNLEGLPARPFDIHPALVHDTLSEADLLVADTQTMVTEAALLGTPAIRSNSFVGDDDMGNFLELEDHGLIFNIADVDEVIETATRLLGNTTTDEEWTRKRDAYMADKTNLTELLVNVATDMSTLDHLQMKRTETQQNGLDDLTA